MHKLLAKLVNFDISSIFVHALNQIHSYTTAIINLNGQQSNKINVKSGIRQRS